MTLGFFYQNLPHLFCDNISALYMTINPVFHAQTKYIEIDYHFVREKVALGTLITQFVPSINQNTDIFTKPLPKQAHQLLQAKLGMLAAPHTSLRGSIKDCKSQAHLQDESTHCILDGLVQSHQDVPKIQLIKVQCNQPNLIYVQPVKIQQNLCTYITSQLIISIVQI